MHAAGRETLTETRAFLLTNLTDTSALIGSLHDLQVLGSGDLTRLRAAVSEERKVHTLVSILQYKDCFTGLLSALEETGNANVASHLKQQEQIAQQKCEKLSQQLPHWLRGRYSESPGDWTAISDLVQGIRGDLFCDLSDPVICSLLTEHLPTVFTSARVKAIGFQTRQSVVENIVSNEARHQPVGHAAEASSRGCPTNPATKHNISEPPSTEHRTSEPPSTEHRTSEPPAREQKTSEPPAGEHRTSEPQSTEHRTSEKPAREQNTSEPPATEHRASEPPVREHRTSEPPSREHRTSEPPSTGMESRNDAAQPPSTTETLPSEVPPLVANSATIQWPVPPTTQTPLSPTLAVGNLLSSSAAAVSSVEHHTSVVPGRLESAAVSEEHLPQATDPGLFPGGTRPRPRVEHRVEPRVGPRVEPPKPESFNLNLRSCASEEAAAQQDNQQFRYKGMEDWSSDDVCTWLSTIQEVGESEVHQFRQRKIRGKALSKMTEEQMVKYFPDIVIGDVWAILEERDKFTPQPIPTNRLGRLEDLPTADGPSVEIQDLYPSAVEGNSNIVRPVASVQPESHRLDLDMFTNPKSDIAEPSDATGAPTGSQESTRPDHPTEDVIELHPTRPQPVPEDDQPAAQQASDRTPEQTKGEASPGDLDEEKQQVMEADRREPPLKTPVKEQDRRETSLKKPVKEEDSMETPLKKPVKEEDTRETPLKKPVKEDDWRETPLKKPVKEEEGRETPLKKSVKEEDTRETPLKKPVKEDDWRETPLKKPVKEEEGRETPLKKPVQEEKRPDTKGPLSQSEMVEPNPLDQSMHTESKDDHETPLKRPMPSQEDVPVPLRSCSCRKFNAAVGLKTYQLGNKLSDSEGVQDGQPKMTRRFIAQESMKSNQEKVVFMSEAVTFICACLNERYNGTIHFGITSTESGGQAGIIRGVGFEHAIKGDFEEMFRKSVQKCFEADQTDIVFHCLQAIQYIPVVDPKTGRSSKDLYVIEVDVAPTAELCANEAFFVKTPLYSKRKKLHYSEESQLFRCFDGSIRACGDEELKWFMQNIEKIAEDHKRKQEQANKAKEEEVERQSDLNLKLSELLCKGENNIPVDLYPILVVNKPPESMTEQDMRDNLSFLADVQFKVTFDFDESGKLSDYVEQVKEKPLKIISTADDFKETSEANMKSPDRLKNLQDDIISSKAQFWIFTNGHRKDRKTPYEWKRQNQGGFREAVRFYLRAIPEGRALIVFLLLSDDTDVMLAAAEELITSFTDQWMVMSELESVADDWAKELVRRDCIDENTWRENSIIGVPLHHISESIRQIQGPVRHTQPMLPTTTGGYIPLREDLPDLDVLSAYQCDNYEAPPPARSKFEIQKEEEFYKGGSVDWWNFFYGHVLARTQLDALKKHVTSALKGGLDEDDNYVGHIRLYHQNGAGGTTLAMNALWDCRKVYRCAVVDSISDASNTAEQILQLRAYGESQKTPKPVLILLDNLDEEKVNTLHTCLEERSKQIARLDTEKLKVCCVLIKCARRNKLPVGKKDKRFLLSHELDRQEQNWFKKKFKELNKNYEDQLIGDPKLLISFNIMKENFDERFMKRTVEGLLADVCDEKEQMLLKSVALLNAFDIQNQAIPTSAFDMMMSPMIWQPGLRYGRGAYAQRWECKLSTSVRVLLNATSQVSMGYVNAIQIASPLLSKYILEAIQAKNPPKQTVSEMVVELFDNKDIFAHQSVARDNLLKIVKDVLKSRQRSANGLPETKFAPMIQAIVDEESTEKAGDAMEKGFGLTNDPFVAQQLARLYIYAKNWGRAEHFAKIATDKKSDNSFLWDTYGRVYLGELTEHYRTIFTTDKSLQPADCAKFVECAFKGIEVFKRVQELSQEETHSLTSNDAGYFGELEMVNSLLDCLSYVEVFDTKAHMKQFLMEPRHTIPQMRQLDEEVDDACSKLKSLFENIKHAITHLEDESLQLRGSDNLSDMARNLHHRHTQKLNMLKGNLDSYFGEASDEAPERFSEEEKCQYRRRRLFQLGTNSMMRIFDLKRRPEGESELVRMKTIVMQNIGTRFETADDLQVLICVNLALVQLNIKYTYDSEIVFEEMVNMSQRLFEKRGTRNFIYLEPFLFYVMFNWPENRRVYRAPANARTRQTDRPVVKPINHRMLLDALKRWKEAYFQKYPKQRDEGKLYRKKDTTIFFFGNGSGINSIISQGSLSIQGVEVKGERFWSQPKVQRELRRFEGVLCSDGEEVELTIEYPSKNKDILLIPTSFPIRDRRKWNKKVFFVIGFSWKGPKAFHINTNDPTEEVQRNVRDHQHFHREQDADVRPKPTRPSAGSQYSELASHAEYLKKKTEYTAKLDEIARLKSKRDKGQRLTAAQMKLIQDEDSIKNRLDHLIDRRTRTVERVWDSSLYEF